VMPPAVPAAPASTPAAASRMATPGVMAQYTPSATLPPATTAQVTTWSVPEVRVVRGAWLRDV